MSNHPQYEIAATALRQRILTGELYPGQQLPPERELCEELGVSRITVRRALSILAEERLIRRRHGSGTYVSPQPTRRIPLMIDYTGSMRAHAPRLQRQVRIWRWSTAPPEIAEELQISMDDDILYAERVDTLDATPVAWDQAYIVRSFAGSLTEHELGRVDFVETWTRTTGFELKVCRQTIEAHQATEEDAEALGLAPGEPLLVSLELYLSSDNRPAGFYRSRYHPHYINFQSTYRWDAVMPIPVSHASTSPQGA